MFCLSVYILIYLDLHILWQPERCTLAKITSPKDYTPAIKLN